MRWCAMALISGLLVVGQWASAGVVLNGTRFIFSYQLAAWRIRRHLRKDKGDIWTRVANYHSRTPLFNQRYRVQLIRRASAWEQWLGVHFPIHLVDETSLVDARAAESQR